MRLVLACLFVCSLVADARAQFVQIVFRDEASSKGYSKYMTKIGATDCVVGEVKAGITFKDGQAIYTAGDKPLNELWAIDTGDPGTPPYSIDPKTNQRVKNKKSKIGSVGIVGDHIAGIRVIDRHRTLLGIAGDYDRMMSDIATLQKERDAKKKAEREWFDLNGRMMAKMDQLSLWLEGLGYQARGKEMKKELEKVRKTAGKSAAAEREKAALGSLTKPSTPPKLADVAAKVSGGKNKFAMQESKHVRFVYSEALSAGEVTAALELAERVIEGFLREFVDPHLDEDYKNFVPDGMIQEFYYGPDDVAIHERMLVDYYGHSWGRNKKDEMAAEGAEFYPKDGAPYLAYRKLVKEIDIPGYTVHTVGHALMDLQFNAGARNDVQDWLREAVGYYVSLNYIGRNGLVCSSSSEASYAATAQKVGIKTAQNGIADYMNQVALKIGPPLETLAAKKLYQIDDADFAKAWSFFDYLARKRGKPALVWLQKSCKMAGDPAASFARDWRKLTQDFNGTDDSQDVFALIEKDWKAYAEKGQIAGIGGAKKP
jgi:hypothetical protein